MLHNTPAQNGPQSLSTPESPNYWQTCPHCGGKVSTPRQSAYNPLRFRECGTCNLVYLPSAFTPRKQKHHLRRVFCQTLPVEENHGNAAVVVMHYAPGKHTHPIRVKSYRPTIASAERLQALLARFEAKVLVDTFIGVSVVYYFEGEVK